MKVRRPLPQRMLATAMVWLIPFGPGALAQAADRITVDLINAAGKRITEEAGFTVCAPSGASCEIAASIANRATGRVLHQAASGEAVGPLLNVRYGYTDAGITKSCQLQVMVSKSAANPAECERDSLDISFAKTDGTARSPLCGPVAVSLADYRACTFVLSVRMGN